MEKLIKINSIAELQYVQRLATKVHEDVYIHSIDNSIMVDAKSFIGLFALDFGQPIKVVSDNKMIMDLL